MEATMQNAVIFIATVAALIRFALLEWESIVHAWKRVTRSEGAEKPVERDTNER
jgi:hypothetical protein